MGKNISLAEKTSMPKLIKPMLATLVDKPFNDEEWLYEIKWDGYRAITYKDDHRFDLLSRNNISFESKFEPIAHALKELSVNAVLDGEIVAVNKKGLPDFQLLQNWRSAKEGILNYYVFDIIWLDGYNLTSLPLIERKKILQKILPAAHESIKYSDHVFYEGESFFNLALDRGLEGIMAKKISGKYETGSRTGTWLKIKVNQRQEVVIAGFTKPRNSRNYFGALLLGVYKGDELIYVGHTGSGFDAKSLEVVHNKLQKLIIDKSPFAETPKTNMPATWVKPKLVCEIKFTEWTKSLQARHPIFMGLREDKNPKDISIEKSKHMAGIIKNKKAVSENKGKSSSSTGKKEKSNTGNNKEKVAKKTNLKNVVFDSDNGIDQELVIGRQVLKFTNLKKLYWKKEGITKGDMLNYYAQIAPYILPYMKDRPQSMHRHPDGINGASFFQKDVRGKVAEWIPTHKSFSESNNETIEYLLCNDEATLLYMANLGCIEMHPWHSRSQKPDNPDYCLIDLDPDTKNSYEQVMEVAHLVKQLLHDAGAECYPKTSGSTGLHIYIPLGAKYSYEQSKQLAELVVNIVHQQVPEFTSVLRNPAKRKGKIYLDFLQNRESQTVAAPYSLRPKPGAPVSTPVDWSEVKKGLTATTYTMHNIFDRLKEVGDIFQPVLKKGVNLQSVLKKIETGFS